MMPTLLPEKIETDLKQELDQILDYWANNTVDSAAGGFLGQIDAANCPVPEQPKA